MIFHRNLLLIFFLFIFPIVLGISTAEATVERRAALDIGSGKAKLTIADLNPSNNRIVKVIHTEFARINFAKSLLNNPDNLLDDDIYAEACEKIIMLRDLAVKKGAVKMMTVATEAFRKASNGIEFLRRLEDAAGVPIQMISQEDEAILGFDTAVQATGYPWETLISWDSGSSSLQLTTKSDEGVVDYLAPCGTTPATHLLLELKGLCFGKGSTPNPITFEEAIAFVEQMHNALPEPSGIFKNKLHREKTKFVGIGDFNSTIGICARAIGKDLFSAQELWDGILLLLEKNDEDLIDRDADTSAWVVLPRLLLTFSVMSKLGIEYVEWIETNGNGLGILVNDHYWKNASTPSTLS
ncbi:MAG: hypothetical protein WB791_07660 [Waddliaceae bacterium]